VWSAEVEQENDGRWLAEVLGLAALAYGQTPMDAVAAAIQSGAMTITNDDFDEMLHFNHQLTLRNEQFHEFTARLYAASKPNEH
jgi:hypothetical protein